MAAFTRQRSNDIGPDSVPAEAGLGPMSPMGAMGNSFLASVLAGGPQRAFEGVGQGGTLPNQARLERSFGDLSGVDVRRGPDVDAVLMGMGALGATRDGKMLLHSKAGPEVVAHEAAHHKQEERFGASNKTGVDAGQSDAAEQDAEHAAKDALAGKPAQIEAAPSAGVHRWSLGGALKDGWNAVKSTASNAWDGVKSGVETVKSTASNAWDSVKSGYETVKDGIGSVKQVAGAAWDTVKAGAGQAWNGAKEGLGNTWNSVKEGASNTWNSVKEGAGNTWNNLKEGAGNTWNSLKEGAGNTWNSLKEGAGNTWNNLKEGAGNTWNSLKDGVGSTLSAGGSTLSSTFGSLLSGDFGGAWNNLKSGASNTWNAGKSTIGNTWGSLKDGVGNTLGAARDGLSSTWGSLKEGATNTWNAGKSMLGNTWGALKDGAAQSWSSLKEGASQSWNNLKTVPGKAWDGFKQGALDYLQKPETLERLGPLINLVLDHKTLERLAPLLGKLDPKAYKAGEALTDPDPNRLYETAPLSTTENSYTTTGMDTPATNKMTSPDERGRDTYTQHYSALGLPLTTEAWERQNKIDGGKLRKLHDETLMGQLQDAGVLDTLVKDGVLKDGQIPKNWSDMDPQALSDMVNAVDDSAAVRDYFSKMKPQEWTDFQTGILDNYIAMANKDKDKAAFLLDVLPTELQLGVKPSELGSQPNDFRAGDDVSAFREGSVTLADQLNGDATNPGKNVYGLVVPYANIGENIGYNKGVPVDGTEHLHNYLGKIDPSTTTMISGYSQGAAVVMDYISKYGGTQGLDYSAAIAPMGGADQKGGTGLWQGRKYAEGGNDTQGVQAITMMHDQDPAQYIHMNDGIGKFIWSLINFTKNEGQVGDGRLHGHYDDPTLGTDGYPMDKALPLIAEMLMGQPTLGPDGKPLPYQQVGDWHYDMQKGD